MIAHNSPVAHNPTHEYICSLIDGGWAVIPIAIRSKAPSIAGWQKLCIRAADVPRYFGNTPCNIGVLLGEPSGGLVDIDIDDADALALAADHLPPTPCVFGRASKPRSHWLYRVDDCGRHAKASTGAGQIEYRSTGNQTVIPDSVHPSGEPIEWCGAGCGEPAKVTRAELIRCITALANAVRTKNGLPPIADGGTDGRAATPTRTITVYDADDTGTIRGKREQAVPGASQAEIDDAICCAVRDAATNGGRNDRGFRLACWLRDHYIPEDDAIRHITTYQSRVPQGADRYERYEAIASVRSAYTHAPSPICGDRLPTDVGNAHELATMFGGQILYVVGSGWHTYTGTRWERDIDGHRMLRYATTTTRMMMLSGDKHYAAHGQRSQQIARLRAMVDLAATVDGMSVPPDEMDADPWMLNVCNGLLNLRTRELIPHDHTQRVTRLADVEYDPAATCPVFDAFLDTIFAGNQAMIEYVLRLLGYCLTGDTRMQILPIFFGDGANGKGTLLTAVSAMMGDYAGAAATDLLMASRQQQHPTDMADLQGRRLFVARETEQGRRLNMQRVKELTGEATIKARRMHQDFFEFRRTCKIILQTNNKPVVRENSEAVRRRLRLVPFNVTIPEAQRDAELDAKLRAESAGILNRLLAGLHQWMADGLPEPDAVRLTTELYHADSDPIAGFIDARCARGGELACAPFAEVRRAYKDYCFKHGERELGTAAFIDAMRRAGFVRGRHPQSRARVWMQLRLLPTA